jgi:penicillin-binding protein 1C
LPSKLFDKPHSTILYSSENILLSGIIATDGQWRFPATDSVPEKFKVALLQFEDKHFYEHSGIYLPSLFRALHQNITQQRVVSGASTITMQTIRMSRDNPARSVAEKVTEMIKAMRLEWRYTKDEILALYASNAPFGGNVVGIDAAAWRYYGRNANQLSWAESATLAVLPNAPSLIFPGKNQEKLLVKRNELLRQLFVAGKLDNDTYQLSLSEPLPQKPYPLPLTAPHLLTSLTKEKGKGKRYYTTLDLHLQMQGNAITQEHMRRLEANYVHNAAVMVVEVKTGNTIIYIGNSHDEQNRYSNMVDVIRAPRSTGSILKPFLYAAMLDDGLMLPNSLIEDIPMQFDGFTPQNYSETFDGAVPASKALSRSLNIPAVVMLRKYGYPRFYHLLKNLGHTHLSSPADHYGLALILGGAESSLWDITHAYAGMSRTLNYYHSSKGSYSTLSYSKKHVLQHKREEDQEDFFPLYDAGSIWCTYQALLEVNRPETEFGWEAYSSASPIAWKTGTSFGNRDAWAVGTTPEYVVGVWVGNADGQGRPELTGITSAAPLLFDIFSILPHRTWFAPPYDDLEKIPVCHESGMRIGAYCEHADTVHVPRSGLYSQSCHYHQKVFTDINKTYQLNIDCSNESQMLVTNWFVLPPVQEYYFKSKHPEYATLPPYAPWCENAESTPIGLIYPKSDAKIFIPKNITGQYERVVLQATHRQADATLYWHMDGSYLGETKTLHHLEINPTAGRHVLTLVDEQGLSLAKSIEIIER